MKFPLCLFAQTARKSKQGSRFKRRLNRRTRHPLLRSMTSSSPLSFAATRSPSMSMAPNSFSMTAMRFPWLDLRMWFRRVVLPALREAQALRDTYQSVPCDARAEVRPAALWKGSATAALPGRQVER